MRKTLFILLFILIFIPTNSLCASTPTRPLSTSQEGGQVKILLVPGHDNKISGAQYGNLKEAAMNLAVASRIHNVLKKDKRFKVYIARDQYGYTQEFTDYFTDHKTDILAFKNKAKKIMQENIINGTFIQKENTPHNSVSGDVAVRLYGFNKWANENNVDAVIHIHFNDYFRPNKFTVGKYKGFAIYTPDEELMNWKESGKLAMSVFTQLSKKYTTSTYEKEKGGLVPDQKLIALGANNTLLSSVRSILIEYGYIYEKRFNNYTIRHQAYDDMADFTTMGIKNYFFEKEKIEKP